MAEPQPARVARLTLTDFRNYPAASVDAGPGLIAVTGPNGSGKTNLLEAVSLLSPGRGLRGDALADMARAAGPGGWSVAAQAELPGGVVRFGTAATALAPERRLLRVNGVAAPLGSLAEWLSVLWLTPALDRLFADTRGARRRFLDRLVLALEPGHARQVTRYEAAMRSRSRLLAGEEAADPAWLAGLERAMAEHGAAMADARSAVVSLLHQRAGGDSAFPRPRLALEGWTGFGAETLAEALRVRRAVDAAAGRATFGPHRIDLAVRFAAKDRPAAASSTGEQKALLLGLVLAHAELVAERTGRLPILLLDEVGAHLDAGRRATLFEELAATGAQVWMTGADRGLFEALDPAATRLIVRDGRIEG